MALLPAGGSGRRPPSAMTDRLDAARERIGRAVFKK
jgi:hypothetical protein